MNITLANINDLIQIIETIKMCISDLGKKGIYQWNENYPTEKIIQNDIENNNLYIIKDNCQIISLMTINEVQEKEWETINWSLKNTKPLCIHRLIIHPSWQKKGLGREFLKFAIEFAHNNKNDSIRFDAYSGNPELITTYTKSGCKKRGEVFFPFREMPFYCFEMDL